MKAVETPWGSYEVLYEDSSYKVKRIIIKPDKRISLQYHKYRNEHWFVVEGSGMATLGEKEIMLKKGDSLNILKEQNHRIHNTDRKKALAFIEVQTGTYLEEDDIVRLHDDFNRAGRC